jgi:hypothetical protein
VVPSQQPSAQAAAMSPSATADVGERSETAWVSPENRDDYLEVHTFSPYYARWSSQQLKRTDGPKRLFNDPGRRGDEAETGGA